jgi:hypothetical protein
MKYINIMKGILLILGIVVIQISHSCSNNKQDANLKCLPGSILIVCLDQNDRPIYPLVIRSKELDTSYRKFTGGGRGKFDKYGFDIMEEYLRVSTVNFKKYSLLRNYIIANNTHENKNYHNARPHTMKMILFDSCEEIMYTVENSNKSYFKKMQEITGAEDSELNRFLLYYLHIQEEH